MNTAEHFVARTLACRKYGVASDRFTFVSPRMDLNRWGTARRK